MNRNKGFAVMFLLGAFLAGGAVGFTADRMMMRHRDCARVERGPRPRLADELGLTPAQRVAFDSLMDRRRAQMRELYRPLRPQLDSLEVVSRRLGDSTHEQLKSILTPEQRVKLDEMRARMRNKDGRKGGPGWYRDAKESTPRK